MQLPQPGPPWDRVRTTHGGRQGLDMDVVVISDETTRDELAEYLANLNHFAKRQMPVVGNGETSWDVAHRRMDGALDDWLAAK